MTIWADVDSLQPEIRDLLERRAGTSRNRLPETLRAASGEAPLPDLVFVAAKPLRHSPATAFVLVEAGPDAADNHIAGNVRPGDLVVTRDLPLADRVASVGITVLNDRGQVFTAENARERRSLRDRAVELRSLGLAPESGRSRNWGKKEFKDFADALDRELARRR